MRFLKVPILLQAKLNRIFKKKYNIHLHASWVTMDRFLSKSDAIVNDATDVFYSVKKYEYKSGVTV